MARQKVKQPEVHVEQQGGGTQWFHGQAMDIPMDMVEPNPWNP